MNNLHLYGIKYSYLIQIILKQIYLPHRILTGTTTSYLSGPGSNDNEEV